MQVETAGVDDKRQITVMFGGTMAVNFLTPQLVYQAETNKCLPSISFPSYWYITFKENYCSNETIVNYIKRILVLYIERKQT